MRFVTGCLRLVFGRGTSRRVGLSLSFLVFFDFLADDFPESLVVFSYLILC